MALNTDKDETEDHGIVPVCLPARGPDSIDMAHVVKALDVTKKWDVDELALQ